MARPTWSRSLATLGDAVILDTRVLMAALARIGGCRRLAAAGGALRVGLPRGRWRSQTAWLAELTAAAAEASVPFLLGGHALVSDGLHILVDTAWLGR